MLFHSFVSLFCAILMRSTNWKLCYTEKVKMVRKFIPAGLYLAFLTSRSQYSLCNFMGNFLIADQLDSFMEAPIHIYNMEAPIHIYKKRLKN